MNCATRIPPLLAVGALGGFALAGDMAMPPMGGPMRHIMVELDGQSISLTPMPGEMLQLQNHGETYEGPAAVLNDTYFNAQYGWMIGGFWTPPEGSAVWIEFIDRTPGLSVYRGGTFAPVFGTDGSADRIMWDGTMLHNWYAATEPGAYEATHSVYIGDETTGEPTVGYTAEAITLHWELAPLVDIDRDGLVGFNDLTLLLGAWGPCSGCPEDVDGDGSVGFDDLVHVLGNWG